MGKSFTHYKNPLDPFNVESPFPAINIDIQWSIVYIIFTHFIVQQARGTVSGIHSSVGAKLIAGLRSNRGVDGDATKVFVFGRDFLGG